MHEEIANYKLMLLDRVAEEISTCTDCDLFLQRKKTVPGNYPIEALLAPVKVVFIGEGPGAEEDKTGETFIGKAGKLLDDLLKTIRLNKTKLFIYNVVKCRPPDNRNPTPDEMFICSYHTYRQLNIIQPDLVVLLGGVAIYFGLQTKRTDFKLERGAKRLSVGECRNKIHRFTTPKVDNIDGCSCNCIATYHPAGALRDNRLMSGIKTDFQFIKKEIQCILKRKEVRISDD